MLFLVDFMDDFGQYRPKDEKSDHSYEPDEKQFDDHN